MRVYIAGPYTKGDVTQNVRKALDMAQKVVEAGHSPFVPHLYHFWHLVHPGPYEQWMELDLEWLSVCEAMIRLPGESPGATIEEEFCQEANIPVYFSLEEFLEKGVKYRGVFTETGELKVIVDDA